MLNIRQAELSDCKLLAEQLRNEDKCELEALGHTCMPSVIEDSFRVSTECFTAFKNEKLLWMMGLREICDDYALVWGIGAKSSARYGRDICRIGHAYLEAALAKYSAVGNMIYSENKMHIKWLKSLGCKFIRQFEYGNKIFYEFIKHRRSQ